MRIAIVVNSFPVLSETFIFNKVKGLLAAGLDVTVLVHRMKSDRAMFVERMGEFPKTLVKPSLLARGVHFLPLALILTVLRNPRQSVRLWQKTSKFHYDLRQAFKAWVLALPLETGQYDLIHFEYSGLAVTYLDALPLLSACLLTSCRGAAEQIVPLVDPLRGEQLRRVFACMRCVHCVSKDMLQTLEHYGLRHVQAFVNHPAIDPEQFRRVVPYPQKEGPPYRLISVGRLHWKKGLEFALLAVRQLLNDGYDVYYDILGGGGEDEKLRFAIADLGLTERVSLRGRQASPAVRQALESADICLLPSLSEGLSNAVLEAMAMELPIVSTIAGGMNEAIIDGQEGFLVPPWQPFALAEKTRLLLQNLTLRCIMGQAGRRRVEQHFNLSRQTTCFVEQYTNLLETKCLR